MIDLFNQPDYTIPNNQYSGNQTILETNRTHFSGQALKVLTLLMSGMPVSSAQMAQEGIIDTRARIFSLRAKGFVISERKIVGGKGAKEWFCTFEQIQFNKRIVNNSD